MSSSKRKIAVVTGTRAEYGLLKWLMKEIQRTEPLSLQCIATGAHFSPEFGNTYNNILNDNIDIAYRVEMQLSSDSRVAVTKSLGLGVIGFADAYATLEPDVLVLLGDRYEILAAAQAAMIARIPIVHLHGGEACEGLIDEPVRHAITKMSHFHFVAADEYKKRVIQLGENPDTVFNIGPMMQDGFNKEKLLSKKEIEKEISFSISEKLFLITYHPVTLSGIKPEEYYTELFDALDEFPDYQCIFTMSNTDPSGKIIFDLIESYCSRNKHRAIAFTSLGSCKYYSLLRLATAVVGNSSSGLLEAPYFRTATVNIGDRQRGRLLSSSVLTCGYYKSEIIKALKLICISEWRQEHLEKIKIPYGMGKPAQEICQFLETVELDNVLMKGFYNIEVNNGKT